MNESPENYYKIEFEIKQIEKEIEIIELLKEILKTRELDEIQLRAAGSSLHSIYNGIEKILQFKIKDKRIKIINSDRWHAEVLMKSRENGIISEKLEENLRELMGFRHFYRHAYGFTLNNENMKPLIENMKKLFC